MKNNNHHQFRQYTLTTDIYKADLPVHAPKELVPVMAETYTKVLAKDKSVIVKLLHLVEKYPDIPQFKNFLTLYYSLSGDDEKAFEINNELLHQFPDYLYARLNMANFYIINDEPEKVMDVLGPTLELCDLFPERKIFHHEEFINFYDTAGQYYCSINETEEAEKILENLYEVADLLDIDIEFKKLEDSIFVSRFENMDFDKFKKPEEAITQRKKTTLPQVKKPPVFHYPQISWLYKYSLAEIPKEKIEELLSLEKEWLRIDLETMIYDAIRRYDFFSKQDLDDDEIDFCVHALYLLKEINAEESLDAVLELLRQHQEFFDFWLFDLLTENMWQVIYTLGINNTTKLADFLKEPLNYTFARSEVSVALTQILLHHPERREEIISLYKNIIDFFISNKTDTTIIDDMLISLMVGDIVEFNGKELLPEIKLLFNEELTDESVCGSLEDIITELDEMPEGEYSESYKKHLQNYFEMKADAASWESSGDIEEDNSEYYDDWEEVEEENNDDTPYFYSGGKPFVRTAPKVGRNEPCPCGSGKKYKNCHGIDE